MHGMGDGGQEVHSGMAAVGMVCDAQPEHGDAGCEVAREERWRPRPAGWRVSDGRPCFAALLAPTVAELHSAR